MKVFRNLNAIEVVLNVLKASFTFQNFGCNSKTRCATKGKEGRLPLPFFENHKSALIWEESPWFWKILEKKPPNFSQWDFFFLLFFNKSRIQSTLILQKLTCAEKFLVVHLKAEVYGSSVGNSILVDVFEWSSSLE